MEYIRAVYSDCSCCSPSFVRGVALLEERAINEALDCFIEAYRSAPLGDPLRAKYVSYCGFARVLAGDRDGLYWCREAIRHDREDGDLYLNLARVEFFHQNRRYAVAALQQGLVLHERHAGLQLLGKKLGLRRRQPIPFLPRGHKLNQWLGPILRRRK